MGDSHGHSPIETRNIKIAFFLNLSFTVLEIVGGFFTNSVAILSDAAHDLGDTISLGASWYFQTLAKKSGDAKYTYGYRRYSILGAFITLFILFTGCVFILLEAIPRLMEPEPVNAQGMIILSVIGIVVNTLAMLQVRKGHSINERVVSLHLLEDVLGWVAVLIGSIIMYFYELPILDPILSIGIAAYILFNVFNNLRLILDVLLQRTPRNVNLDAIKSKLLEHEAVQNVDHMHVWSMDGEYHIMTVELYFKPGTTVETMEFWTDHLHKDLKEVNIEHATFECKVSR